MLAHSTHEQENWRVHEKRKRAMREPLRPRTAGSTASLRNVLQNCTMMRSNRPCAAATARKSHARVLHASA
eukprot:7652675-Lingulodinium_polyedra.AAC.1